LNAYADGISSAVLSEWPDDVVYPLDLAYSSYP